MDKLDDKSRAEIMFVGSTLGPLFLHDPEHDAQVVATGLEALASLDVEAAAKDWPFVSAEDAERALALMHEGLAEGHEERCSRVGIPSFVRGSAGKAGAALGFGLHRQGYGRVRRFHHAAARLDAKKWHRDRKR